MSNQQLCTVCGSRPGAVGVTQVVNGERRTAVLCERCATELMSGHGMGGEPGAGGQSPFGPGATPFGPGQGAPAFGGGGGEQSGEGSKTPSLDEFGRDLTAEAAEGQIDPVVGRSDEIAQTVEILARRRKNNAVLIGEAGVGKTAIAEGLALQIAEGEVPETLRDTRVVALDLSGMLAGSQFRGQFEQRLKTALEEAAAPEANVLLFVDELHTVLGAGAAEGAMDAANMLKPMLARGELRVIGATTLAEFRKIERDAALARRFSAVTVSEPSIPETVEILRGLRPAYQEHHEVEVSDAALEAAARLSDRYVSEHRLPDKAIDLVDQAAARVRLRGGASPEEARLRGEIERLGAEKQAAVEAEAYERAGELKQRIEEAESRLAGMREKDGAGEAGDGDSGERSDSAVTERDVAEVVAARTGIPVGELVAGELERLHTLERDLHERVIGQEQPVATVAETIRHARAGLSEPGHPLGSFLFLGPTGVGKTELVKALAERLFATEKALVRVDMSEYREAHTVARLIGSPPGYVGYGEGGQLSEPVRRRPYSVVLLDEVEKAHPEVWNVLLQIMDDGRLTDGEGRTVDFTNTVVVMTSNLGAGKAARPVGFAPEGEGASPAERMLEASKQTFLPEFLNRIDEIVLFEPLSPEQIEQISALVCSRVGERLAAEHGVELEVEPDLVARLAREGFDEEFGARPLKRHVRRTLERELTRAILDGRLTGAERVRAHEREEGGIDLEVVGASERMQAAA